LPDFSHVCSLLVSRQCQGYSSRIRVILHAETQAGVTVTQETNLGEEPGSNLCRITVFHDVTRLKQEESSDSSFKEATNAPKRVSAATIMIN
jgi:hypothetical protein